MQNMLNQSILYVVDLGGNQKLVYSIGFNFKAITLSNFFDYIALTTNDNEWIQLLIGWNLKDTTVSNS